jgi:hypothetical protein
MTDRFSGVALPSGADKDHVNKEKEESSFFPDSPA